jgi:hypothetical protein
MEIWKSINGYDDYQISNLGRVKSLKYNKERILKPFSNSDGYLTVELRKNKDESKYCRIHNLIALAFIPNPYNKSCIDHIDRNKTNNSINNLRWVTHQENMCNISVKKNNVLQQQYISPVKYKDTTYYRIQHTRNHIRLLNKTVKTLEEAIQLRDNFLNNCEK